MISERQFRHKIVIQLNKIKNSYFESIQQQSIRGTPDLLGCINGRFIALELKKESGKASLMQLHKLQKFRSAGGFAAIVKPSNFDEVYEQLLKISEEKNDYIKE